MRESLALAHSIQLEKIECRIKAIEKRLWLLEAVKEESKKK